MDIATSNTFVGLRDIPTTIISRNGQLSVNINASIEGVRLIDRRKLDQAMSNKKMTQSHDFNTNQQEPDDSYSDKLQFG